jgi:NADH:ubiquinone oxidoreductase subunit H
MLAYELIISMMLLQLFLFTGSLNITEVVLAQQDAGIWFLLAAGPFSII